MDQGELPAWRFKVYDIGKDRFVMSTRVRTH